MSKEWSAATDPETVARRAGGRRRYNSVRAVRADLRRSQLAERLARSGMGRGFVARLAREFGVSESTVSRDVGRLLGQAGTQKCPHCGRTIGLGLRALPLSVLAPIDMADVKRKAAAMVRQAKREQLGDAAGYFGD